MSHLSIIHEVLPMGFYCKNQSFLRLAFEVFFNYLKLKEMDFPMERNLGLLFESIQ